MNITIDTDALLKCSNSLENVNFELKENMNRIEQLILGLGSEWQGDSGKMYQSKILFVKKQFEYMSNLIDEYTANIKTVSQNYDQVEKDIISKLGV
ncbi:MAG: WXG100 family type VII secretion target [Clostridia bacterium]|nr:WXG100 family type VII secretion target [Clostridia bacterium]